MIKLNQPLTLTLTVNDVATGASATIEARKPDGTVLTWTATLDTTEETVTYAIPANILDVAGTWRAIAVVTYSDGKVIPGEAYEFDVRRRYD